MKSSQPEAGFTVIEVIVALMLLTASLTALYRSMSGSFAGLNVARVREGIVNHGLTELELVRRYPAREREKSGT